MAAKTAFWSGVHSFNSASNFSGVARETSFPFISSDTFRSVAGTIISNERSPEDLNRVEIRGKNLVTMVELSFLKNKGGQRPLVEWVKKWSDSFERPIGLVLHNGDWIPSQEYLASLTEAGSRVFCVNTTDEIPGVTPIPVGLENSIRRKNGVLHDFLFVHDIRRGLQPSLPQKTERIFSSFKVSTNPAEREPLVRTILDSRFSFIEKRLSTKDFRKGVLNSKFVLSPPGNGPDCYRTWESIYLGAVPVVLRHSLAESLFSELPIWAVDSWEEALFASDEILDETYLSIIQKDKEKAYFPYWLQQLFELQRI